MELSIVNLLLVLLAAWVGGLAASRVGYPTVLGELLVGILLGPPLLGLLQSGPALEVLAEVGILLMMLYIGMEIDPRELGKASKAGLLAAMGGFITPFVLCYVLIIAAGGTMLAALFVGVAAGVTSLTTKSRILVDLKLLDTRIAHVMMAGALMTDTACLVIFAGILSLAELGNVDMAALLIILGRALVFFGVAAVLGLKVFPLLGRLIQRAKALTQTASFMLVLLIALAFAEMAELAGMHGILGAFIAGLFLREQMFGSAMSKSIVESVHQASIGFLAPVFFVTAGFAVSVDVFSSNLALLLGVIGLATAGKVVGTMLFYLPTGHGWREGLTLGGGMNGRGAVEIIIAQIGLSMGLISQEVFSILVFMAIGTTAMVPFFLKWGTDWLHRRGELVRSEDQRKGTLIVGASPAARLLGRILSRSQPVWIVDRNKEQCAMAEADGLNVICGNALDEEVLSQAHAAHVRALIALTPNAEVNTLASQLGRNVFYIPEVHILNGGDDTGHAALLEHLNATTIFGGAVQVADWDYRVDHEEVERNGLTLQRPVPATELFQKLQEHHATLPVALRRGDQYLPFHSGSTLHAGDRIIMLEETDARTAPFDRFDRLVAHCPVLDVERAVSAATFFELVAAGLAPRLGMEPAVLADMLLDRERTSSTVLLPGLAIPHTVIDGHEQFEVALVRCREGIVFPSQEESVHAAFVLVGTTDERNFHLRALSAIAQIVQWPDFEKAWLMAPDAEALRRLVLRASRRRLPEGSDPTPPSHEPALMV